MSLAATRRYATLTRQCSALRDRIAHPRTDAAERDLSQVALARLEARLAELQPAPVPQVEDAGAVRAAASQARAAAAKAAAEAKAEWGYVPPCSWVRDPAGSGGWAVRGPIDAIYPGAVVTVQRRDGSTSQQRIVRLGPLMARTRCAQIGYVS